MDKKTAAMASSAAVSFGTVMCLSAAVKMFKTRKRKGPHEGAECKCSSRRSRRCKRRPASQTAKLLVGGFSIGAGLYGFEKIFKGEDLQEIVLRLPEKEEVLEGVRWALERISEQLSEMPDRMERLAAAARDMKKPDLSWLEDLRPEGRHE